MGRDIEIRRQVIMQVRANQSSTSLSRRFKGGSLARATQVGLREYAIALRPDRNMKGWFSWYTEYVAFRLLLLTTSAGSFSHAGQWLLSHTSFISCTVAQ